MAKYIVFALLVVSFVISANSLTCYDCKGSSENNCEQQVKCGNSISSNQKTACIKRIYKTNSLTCYDCNGPTEKNCDQHVKCGNTGDPNQKTACIKRIYKKNTETEVKRGCAFVAQPYFDKALECKNDDTVCESCMEDLCNSATSIGKFSLLTIFALCLPILFVY